MGGTRDGILGLDVDRRNDNSQATDGDILGGGDPPGTLGGAAIPLDDIQRMIAKTTKDWEPPQPDESPIVIGGTTLAQAFRNLNAQGEWGKGGGQLRTDRIAPGNSTDLTVKVHANLVHRLPKWTGYDKASQAAKDEWDQMVVHLKAHEDRHLAIAIEEADQLAKDLVGHEISDIVQLVTDANRRLHDRQEELDNDTEHGAKAGVPFGDVLLDPTIK
jgi:hypothetical protein